MPWPPRFIAELALPAYRSKLRLSITSGYATAAVFALIGVSLHAFHIVSPAWPVYAIVGFKLLTNTIAYFCLRRDALVLEAGALNVFADVLAMTAAMYFTGGQDSQFLAMYALEVSVVALLTNLGTTVLVAIGAFAMYGAMSVLVYTGALPPKPPLVVAAGGLSAGYLATNLVYVAVVLGVPTLYTASILRTLRDKKRELEARNSDLTELGKQKSQFMANITHELRTPIHGICGLSDLVESGVYGPVTEKQREAHETIKRSARSLLQLVDDLLELSRADAGKLRYDPSEVELSELCPSVLATVRWMAGTRARRLDVDVEEGLSPLFTDRGKLNQVLINLLANAVKFTDEGGTITLSARRAGPGAVAISVADDGVGIPASELETIFEAFHQVDGSNERVYGGAGLGLALVTRLAAVMQGEVRVTSEVGKGATFTITLPLRREADAPGPDTAP